MTDALRGPDESERLLQRFVDQDLSADERLRLIARLGRDASLRQRAIGLERVVLEAGHLPKPTVPDAFVSRVMERLAPQAPPVARPSLWHRLTDALVAPRDLRWNLAGAIGCLAVLLVGGVVAGRLTAPRALPATAVAGGATPADSMATPSPVLIRLVVLQPRARSVHVVGDFNGWNPARTPLERVSDDGWSVTIPLEPGRYKYMFVVDGEQWIPDPFAVEQSDDGFGSRNAVLDVRPPSGAQS